MRSSWLSRVVSSLLLSGFIANIIVTALIQESMERGRFPSTIAEFGYTFDENGELKGKDGQRFDFEVRKGDKEYNQRHYEALGECITQHVYSLLETDCGLERATVPERTATRGQPTSFLFHSSDLATNDRKLMVLIHGSGVVRAGQWARRLIINNNLNVGTQIPFIKRAISEGHAVLVLNTNENAGLNSKGVRTYIPESDSPEAHALYAFEYFVKPSPAREVYVVAHSYGGVVVTALARESHAARNRITKIALTDSVHSLHGCSRKVVAWLQERSINWVASKLQLGLPVSRYGGGAHLPSVSAGVDVHEWTSSSAMESIFTFFNDRPSEPGSDSSPKSSAAKRSSDGEASADARVDSGLADLKSEQDTSSVAQSESVEESLPMEESQCVRESQPMEESQCVQESQPMEESQLAGESQPMEESQPA
eukprot:scpid53909/ scgid32214/ Protein FAM172A